MQVPRTGLLAPINQVQCSHSLMKKHHDLQELVNANLPKSAESTSQSLSNSNKAQIDSGNLDEVFNFKMNKKDLEDALTLEIDKQVAALFDKQV